MRAMLLACGLVIVTGCCFPVSREDPPEKQLPAPTGLTAIPGDSSVMLEWQEPTADTESLTYEVYRGTTPENVTTRAGLAYSGSFKVSDLSNGTTYYFAVRAMAYEHEPSPYSETVSATPERAAFAVTQTSPANNAQDVSRASSITLTFNENVQSDSVVVESTPPHEFQSSAGFFNNELKLTPVGLLAGNQLYTLRVKEGLSITGRPLSRAHVFAFTTGWTPQPTEEATPSVTQVTPATGSANVFEKSAISVQFSKPMDQASVQAAWSMRPPVTCSFSWNGNAVTCTPSAPLATDKDYVLTIAASAFSADSGRLPLASSFTSGFHTAGPPSVTGVTPLEATQGHPRSVGVGVKFSKPMDCASVLKAFRFSSPVTDANGSSCSGTGATFRPSAGFSYGDQVSWSLAATATDELGNPLTAGAAGSFRVARAATKVLGAVAARDGFVGEQGTVSAGGTAITTGATAGNERLRGLLTFDLGELPPETLRIGAATLRVQQGQVRGTPFDRFGSLYTVSVPFGEVATPAFNAEPDTRTVCEFIFFCHEEPRSYTLSSSSSPGPRSLNVTDKVSVDFNARAQRANRSQFRTYFTTTNSDGGTKLDGTQQEVDLGSGEASSGKPSLEVLYEYP